MQPEPNETSQKDSLDSNNPDPQFPAHHGYHHTVSPLPHQHLAGDGRIPSRPPSSRALSDTSSEGSTRSSDGTIRRLITTRRQAGSPKITEHEEARKRSSRKKGHGQTFTVVARTRTSGAFLIGITDIPNEILTHVLSHLSPSSLSNVSLVSKRFHQLVTSPHAWRSAFSRFFPGADAIVSLESTSEESLESEPFSSEKRVFTRLTPNATWRSEYVLRSRLLRSLARGKPAKLANARGARASSSTGGSTANAQITYSSNLVCPVNHLDGSFGVGLNKNQPRFVHGADEIGMASRSDPSVTKVDNWGFQDVSAFRQFSDLFPGDAEYGLGAGDTVGNPNVMDLSQLYGMIYGEGHEHDSVLWFRHTDEKRGRQLLWSTSLHQPENGIPQLAEHDAYCSVWIAKSSNVPDLTEGLVGILAGSSTGVLTAYSIGTNAARDVRFERGEITARWVLSPGVPIIGIAVDGQVNAKRMSSGSIWAVALNALGEVFYLTKMPSQPQLGHLAISQRSSARAQEALETLAWATGRSTQWLMIETTRRLAKIDPFERSNIDGSYSPRSSCDDMRLSPEQLAAETNEIESFLRKRPKDFRKSCHGWDMRRRLEVDFAASEEDIVGESIVTMCCGFSDDVLPSVKRYTRCKVQNHAIDASDVPHATTATSAKSQVTNGNGTAYSIFGYSSTTAATQPSWSFSSPEEMLKDTDVQEWRSSDLNFGGLRAPQITTSALDSSSMATLIGAEDPLFPDAIPSSNRGENTMEERSSTNSIPGCRARLMAIGTTTGAVLLYNLRAPVANNTIIENHVKPVRMIYTDSPQISCLALTALCLVHGGNDGLVQAWDPLASSLGPIRTLNSRFSSRARRRLIQAEASPAGVGVNLYAASALFLDPDPTVLRGIVSLGSHLRYWSYKSDNTDQYKGNKRRLRRSERGSNQATDRFSGTGRGSLKDYIANEKLELEREKRSKIKEDERLSGRFGIDLLGPGASEDEIMAYATMLSEEAAQTDEVRRKSASESSDVMTESNATSPSLNVSPVQNEEDIAEAIRLSLQDPGAIPNAGSSEVPVQYIKAHKSTHTPQESPPVVSENDDDLQYALQLSLAEQESKAHTGKGKGREA